MSAYCEVCDAPLSKPTYRRCSEHRAVHRKHVIRRKSSPPTALDTPCRVWQGAVDRDGYGAAFGGRIHRWVVEQIDGPIEDGLVVMHLCDNPPCYRYDHLRVGTAAENNADKVRKGRNAKGNRNPFWMWKSGEEHTQAKLTWAQVRDIRARLELGEVGRRLAEEYGVCPATITNIKKGLVWREEDAA